MGSATPSATACRATAWATRRDTSRTSVIGGYIFTLGTKLLNREERFDRLVIDKKIESREAYFKGLQKLVDQTGNSEKSVAEGWDEYQKAKGEAEKKKVFAKFRKRENVLRSFFGKFFFKKTAKFNGISLNCYIDILTLKP